MSLRNHDRNNFSQISLLAGDTREERMSKKKKKKGASK